MGHALPAYHEPRTRFVADFIGQGVFLPGTVLDDETVSRARAAARACGAPAASLPGTAVDVLLRPDDILHDDSSPLQARVLHKAFRGAEFLYTLQLPAAAACSRSCRAITITPSASIGIRLEIDHVVAFPRGE